MDDSFGTAALRAAFSTPGRPRQRDSAEDANAEEDLRLGGYADTWFVELAQNAADAAGPEVGCGSSRSADAEGPTGPSAWSS